MIHLTILIILLLFLCRRLGRVRRRRHSARYKDYMQSPEWRAKKREVYEHYGRQCATCGCSYGLSIHHWHYRTLGNERMKDVAVLCRKHHNEADVQRRRQAKRWRWLWA